jgi:hypothetical protein
MICSVARPLPTEGDTNMYQTQTSMPRVGLELRMSMFEWVKTFRALDRAATIIDRPGNYRWSSPTRAFLVPGPAGLTTTVFCPTTLISPTTICSDQVSFSNTRRENDFPLVR